MNTEKSELDSLSLLIDTQTSLRDALNSLGGKEAHGVIEKYLFYTAAMINRVVEGYAYLRESRRFESSKFLIRTAIEATLKIKAVRQKPETLFRILFTEDKEKKKWIRSFNNHTTAEMVQSIEDEWRAFVSEYRNAYPEHEVVERDFSIWDVSASTGLERYYNSHYRLYCQFTHATFDSNIGNLGVFENEDNRTMTLCALAAIEALVSIGAEAPHLHSLEGRLPQRDEPT